MQKMLLIISAILLSSCAGLQLPKGAPKPPPFPDCDIIAVENDDPYLKCKWSTGGDVWRIPIDQNLWKRQEKYMCTTDQGYADLQNYGKSLKRWADNHCK